MEFATYKARWESLKEIDPYVDYDIEIATVSYIKEIFPATLFFCAVALEEQLSAIYEVKNKGETGKLSKLKDMDLNSLLDWAVTERIINGTFDLDSLHAIREARNVFGHATRIMQSKTKVKMEKGKFDGILPKAVTIPDWFKEMVEFHEKATGTKVDLKKKVIGWLYDKETAFSAYKVTIEFIEATSKILK